MLRVLVQAEGAGSEGLKCGPCELESKLFKGVIYGSVIGLIKEDVWIISWVSALGRNVGPPLISDLHY